MTFDSVDLFLPEVSYESQVRLRTNMYVLGCCDDFIESEVLQRFV